MVRSMTGYGRCERELGSLNVVVEIKSVNHRYFEFSAKLPRTCGFLEDRLKSFCNRRIARGKVECFVAVENLEDGGARVLVDHALAAGYVRALDELSERYALEGRLTAVELAGFPDVLVAHKAPENEDSIWAAVESVAGEALESLLQMREAEGGRLRQDILARADAILACVEFIEERSPQTVLEYREKLKQRIRELLQDAAVDEQRLLTEAAVFADRIAVDEETVRLRSHLAQLRELLKAGGAVGRKLDFLVQELNREANTVGSKAQDAEIIKKVLEVKAETEKIREQVQNIE